jgi:hypothetical protein
MTAKQKDTNLNAGQSTRAGRSKRLLATFAWLAFAPLLAGCVGYVISPVPPAPQQQDAWLSFKFQSPNGSPGCGSYQNQTCGLTDVGEATAYYNALGIANPGAYKFSNWLTDNGFANVGPGQLAHAIYFNKLDLQFGRDMNCWQNGQTVACYVVNYGPKPTDPGWPDRTQALDDANNHTHPPFATVAMVYNPTIISNQVSFYVFNNGKATNAFDPTTVPLDFVAALDTEGAKTVPRMCMGCHGGSYTHSDSSTNPPTPASVAGAQFLPFDVFSFGLDASSSGQQAFLDLNAFVLATKPNPAIADFINGTYEFVGPVGPPFTQQVGNTQILDFVPANWALDNTRAALYGSTVRTYCRMCHLAQSRNFGTFDGVGDAGNFSGDSGLIEAFVCGNGDMPHMEVPFGPQNNQNLSHAGIGLWLDVDPQARKDLHDFLQSVNGSTKCPAN